MTNFNNLPAEIQQATVGFLIEIVRHEEDKDTKLAPYVTVCRDWQAVIERYTFSNLTITLDRIPRFGEYVQNHRRRCLRHIDLHVELPTYENDPCQEKEAWQDKLMNNTVFTATFRDLFRILHDWDDGDVVEEGISLLFSIWSASDLRKSGFELWQRRRWNVSDIGEKRFSESYIDFLGQDEELKRLDFLQPVYAISSFRTDPLNRRAIMPAAYCDIIANLPRVRDVSLDVVKERRLILRRSIFDELGDLLIRWPPSIESLSIHGNTLAPWRSLPHEAISESDTGERLCEKIRAFSSQLKHLRIRNFVRIKELLAPVWVQSIEDREPFLVKAPNIPIFHRLETIDINYGSVYYKVEWYKDTEDLNKHEATEKFRQSISLAAARLAYNMPKLRHMVIAQRPLMWAGKHHLEYVVSETEAKVTWESTFEFQPWPRTIEAWTVVAKENAGQPLKTSVVFKGGWHTDGHHPVLPAISF